MISPASSLRPLLPRTSKTPNEIQLPVASKDLPPQRRVSRFKVVRACQSCRIKKVKCDGERPKCGSSEATRAEDLVKKQEVLQENVESFASLYRYLQDRPSNEANRLFERIRDGFSIEAALEFVKAEGSNSTLAYRDPPSARVEWTPQLHDCKLLFENDLLSIEASDVLVQALRHGVDCYHSYLGTMFPIYAKPEVDMIITTSLASEPADQEAASDQLVNKKIAYGELLAICALGFQYDRQTLPNGNGTISMQFFKKARLFIDFVVEKAPLRAMRICCCLGIYNVIAKSSLAISYTDPFIDRGILLGSSTGLGVGKRPPSLSEDDFEGYIKTFRALITVRSWVTATLGHIPSPEVSRCIHITVLKANILRTVACFRVLSSAVLRQMRDDLEAWRSSLPVYMRLEALVQSPEISPDQRRVTFYMHLFYMSALILKTRALLATQWEISSCSRDSEAASVILEGIHAARSSARLLGLIYDEKTVVKNCWLTIYQCYVTCLTLNYITVKSFLVGGATVFRKQDIVLSDKCIEILALCATKDRIAHSFHIRLCKYQNILRKHLPKSPNNDTKGFGSYGDDSFDGSYLFAETNGDTKLHQLMHELWEMLCYPLTFLKGSTETELRYPTIMEASVNADMNFARHLASPFNMAEDEVPVGLFPPGDCLGDSDGCEKEVEGYVTGDVPYDWDVSPGTRNPGVEAT
ncbi:hypothetical protein FOXB_06706 [Fusarium oxysporum f. sp. conglutinans Fo5176]|uniref:Zn(2)-C6 fungal-type domain-containing protein n=1 Tax=Fusarium oxysporum (strain Fo5176) TaxID=660025 RepID=F9FJX7_FUSOF|nr:hypothetical protein FOXB_06706 [Fusarium oxysporum f. sp. conglutinans Fo5176]